MPEPVSTTDTPRHPSTIALGIMVILTLLAVIALGWLWLDRYAPVHYDIREQVTIDDARAAARIIPILWLGIFLIALLWLLTWIRARWEFTLFPMAIGIIGVLALLFAGRAVWQAADTHQPIRVITWLCEADSARVSDRGGAIPDGCEMSPDPEAATLGTAGDPAMEEPDEDDAAASAFPELPRGAYDAVLTTTAPPDTASALLVVETGDSIQPVSRLEHRHGLTWSGTIMLHPDLETYLVLVYPSPHEPVPDARITFTVQACSGTTLADFDASDCEPASIDDQVVDEIPPGSTDAGRPLAYGVGNEAMTVTNLEARTYTFTPSLRSDSLRSGRNDMLVIPADGPQVSDRNILDPGSGPLLGSFSVEVDDDTEEIAYIIYLFEDGPTVASAAEGATGMRP